MQTVGNYDELKYNISKYDFDPEKFKDATNWKYTRFTELILTILLENNYKKRPQLSILFPLMKKFKQYLDSSKYQFSDLMLELE